MTREEFVNKFKASILGWIVEATKPGYDPQKVGTFMLRVIAEVEAHMGQAYDALVEAHLSKPLKAEPPNGAIKSPAPHVRR